MTEVARPMPGTPHRPRYDDPVIWDGIVDELMPEIMQWRVHLPEMDVEALREAVRACFNMKGRFNAFEMGCTLASAGWPVDGHLVAILQKADRLHPRIMRRVIMDWMMAHGVRTHAQRGDIAVFDYLGHHRISGLVLMTDPMLARLYIKCNPPKCAESHQLFIPIERVYQIRRVRELIYVNDELNEEFVDDWRNNEERSTKKTRNALLGPPAGAA